MIAFLIWFSLAHADAPAKASMCMSCHGPSGESPNEQWPNLAGQKQAYLRQQLRDFRDGRRLGPVMGPVARTLSDQDIAELAAYYAQIKK